MTRTATRTASAIFLLFLGLFGLTFHGYVDVEDVEVCYQSTRNLVENGSLSIGDSAIAQRIAAERFYVVEGEDGEHYPIYPLAQLLAPVPFYVAGKVVSGFASEPTEDVVRLAYSSVNVFAGALLCAVVFLLSVRLGNARSTAVLCALLAGTCTMLWAYAQGTFADLPLALLVACAGYCLLSAPREGDPQPAHERALRWIVAAGILHGLAVLFRPAALLLLLPSLAYLRRSGVRRYAAFLTPIVLLAVGTAVLDNVVLGRPPEASYAGQALSSNPLVTYSYSLSAMGLLFSDGKGLFMLSPVLVLAILAFPELARRNRSGAFLVLEHFVVLWLFFAAFDGWYAGWCWGPRYLLPCVPFLAAAMGAWLERTGAWRRALTVALVATSLWIQLLSIAVPNRVYMTMIASNRGSDLTQFFFYARFSPVLAHQRILLHKLGGGEDVYSQALLFGDPDTRAIDVTTNPDSDISRFNRGFDHFAWVRLFAHGRRAAAASGAAACVLLACLGGWRLWRIRKREEVGRELGIRAG